MQQIDEKLKKFIKQKEKKQHKVGEYVYNYLQNEGLHPAEALALYLNGAHFMLKELQKKAIPNGECMKSFEITSNIYKIIAAIETFTHTTLTPIFSVGYISEFEEQNHD